MESNSASAGRSLDRIKEPVFTEDDKGMTIGFVHRHPAAMRPVFGLMLAALNLCFWRQHREIEAC
jgi:hypothetical protein